MCFKKTFAVIEEIELWIKQEMPFQTYGRGCHLISDAACRILQKLRYAAELELVGFYSSASAVALIPHFIRS